MNVPSNFPLIRLDLMARIFVCLISLVVLTGFTMGNKETGTPPTQMLSLKYQAAQKSVSFSLIDILCVKDSSIAPNDYLLHKAEAASKKYQILLPKGVSIEQYVKAIMQDFPRELLEFPFDKTKVSEEIKRRFSIPSNSLEISKFGLSTVKGNISVSISELFELSKKEAFLKNLDTIVSFKTIKTQMGTSISIEYQLSPFLDNLFSNNPVEAKVYIPNELEEYANDCAKGVQSEDQSEAVKLFMRKIMSGLLPSNAKNSREIEWGILLEEIRKFGYDGNGIVRNALTKICTGKLIRDFIGDKSKNAKFPAIGNIYITFKEFDLIPSIFDEKAMLIDYFKGYCDEEMEKLDAKEISFDKLIIDQKLGKFKPVFQSKYLFFAPKDILYENLAKILVKEFKIEDAKGPKIEFSEARKNDESDSRSENHPDSSQTSNGSKKVRFWTKSWLVEGLMIAAASGLISAAIVVLIKK